MVGLSMALTIAVCIGSFVWIYAQVDPLTRDFVDVATVPPTRKAQSSSSKSTSESDSESSSDAGEVVAADEQPTETPEATATSVSFKPTHRVISEIDVNLRPGPAVGSGEPVTQVSSGAELQYLGETELSEDPDSDGQLNWLKFRTEDGFEGWIREVDVEPINSGQ